MRILIDNVNGDPWKPVAGGDATGQNIYVREVSSRMAALGHRVDVATRAVSPDNPLIEEAGQNLRVLRIQAGPSGHVFRDTLAECLDEYGIGLIRLMEKENRRYDVIHGNYWLSAKVVCSLFERKYGRALFYTPHSLGRLKTESVGYRNTVRDEIEEKIMRNSDGIQALSVDDRRCAEERYETRGMIRRIPHGIDFSAFHYIPRRTAREKLGWNTEKRIILFVGRFEDQKDLPMAFRVFSEVVQTGRNQQSFELVVCGGPQLFPPGENDLPFRDGGVPGTPQPANRPDGDVLAGLPEKIRTAWSGNPDRDKIKILGWIPNDRLKLIYAAADVLLMPSRYEPFGMVASECLATGTPVAASETGGLKETVVPGKNGILSPVGDIAGYRRAVEVLLEPPWTDEKTRENRIAREVLRLSWDNAVKSLEGFYREILILNGEINV